jgi:hypothetical protein
MAAGELPRRAIPVLRELPYPALRQQGDVLIPIPVNKQRLALTTK